MEVLVCIHLHIKGFQHKLQVQQQLLLVQKIQHTMHIILDLGKLNSIIKIVVFQQLVLQVVLVIVTKLLMVKLIAVLVVK